MITHLRLTVTLICDVTQLARQPIGEKPDTPIGVDEPGSERGLQ
jgi:hypothetical protein